jgi:uncharacterized phage-associated protein
MNLNDQFDRKKFEEAIIYLIRKSQADEHFGKTKLAKLLFFADFASVKQYLKPLTGVRYRKQRHGPLAPEFDTTLHQLAERGEIASAQRNHFGYRQETYFALREPNVEVFTTLEIELLNQVLQEKRELSASDVSSESHEFLGWKAVEVGSEIPYEAALAAVEPPSEEDRALLLSLNERYHWSR